MNLIEKLKFRRLIIVPTIFVIVGTVFFYCFFQKESVSVANPIDAKKVEYVSAVTQSTDSLANPVPPLLMLVQPNSYFFDAITSYQLRVTSSSSLTSAILPHHDLASSVAAEVFAKIASSGVKPKTVIIIGPNHSDVGLAPAISAPAEFETSIGRVNGDNDLLEELERGGYLTYDEENFLKEFSVSILTPFVKNYFPEARVATIILTSKQTKEDDFALAEKLNELMKKDNSVVLLGSIDFSHYLTTDEATNKDAETWQAIEALDYAKIEKFTSDNLDSPDTLITLLRTNELLGKKPVLVVGKNSADFLGRDLDSSTSYLGIIFH